MPASFWIVWLLFTALHVALSVMAERRRRARHAVERALWQARLDDLREELNAAEARSRGVGGTGEHGAPVVSVISPVSRVLSMHRDPRFTIPTDRPRGA